MDNNPAKFRDGIKTPFTQYNELTTAEKLALPQVTGTVVYDTDLDKLQVFDGVNWVGYFNAALDTADDIIEGNTNKFITVFERDKLNDIVFDGNLTAVGIFTGGVSAGINNSFFGRQSGNVSNGSNNSFYGYLSGDSSTGDINSFFGNLSGFRSNGGRSSFFGYGSGSNSLGSDITAIGRNAGVFTLGNTLQTPNSTAIGSRTIIDKANQAAIGDVNVTELKIGETLVIDKSQIVTGAEGVLVTKKLGGKTIVEVSNDTYFKEGDDITINNGISLNIGENASRLVYSSGSLATFLDLFSSNAFRVRDGNNGFNNILDLNKINGILTLSGGFSAPQFIIQGGVYATDAEAGAAGVLPNRIYKAPNGELRYKL